MTGVSVTKPRGQDPLSLLLPIAADPEGTSKRLAELTEATARHLQAVEAHGKADQIDALLAQAQQTKDEAQQVLAKARERDKKLLAKAEADIAEMRDEANAKLAEDRKRIKAAQGRLQLREARVRDKESQIEPLHAAAVEASERAEAERAKANSTRQAFERKIRVLEEAVREATR